MHRIQRICFILLSMLLLWLLPSSALAATRALLVACSDFVSQPDLGSAISGNLHMIGSALISTDMHPGDLSIEDGTIGTSEALKLAIDDTFSEAAEDDLSILYLCTHGVLSSSDDGQVYLLLGDGVNEDPLSADELYSLVRDIQGEKLLILDACYSGALIGRGMPLEGMLPGSKPEKPALPAGFLLDPSVHVLTSANGHESSWYYDSEHLSTGAVSYFASALSSGLGLYGAAEADLSGDGSVTLAEMHQYLNVAVPSSSSQLLSSYADAICLPSSAGASLARPLTDFAYSTSLIHAEDPAFDFSFTVTREATGVQYRLVEYAEGSWDWENAVTFLDNGESEDGLLAPGRKNRTLVLENALPEDRGYLMLQVFSVSSGELTLCSERLIGVQPAECSETPAMSCPDTFSLASSEELPIDIHLSIPGELTVSIYDAEGRLVRRLASSRMTRPSPGSVTHLYWDGRDAAGSPVPDGPYTITCETRIGGSRQKTSADVTVCR